jgi:hypothetical protein
VQGIPHREKPTGKFSLLGFPCAASAQKFGSCVGLYLEELPYAELVAEPRF